MSWGTKKFLRALIWKSFVQVKNFLTKVSFVIEGCVASSEPLPNGGPFGEHTG